MLVSGLVLLGSLTRESGPVEAQTSGVRLGLPALWRRPQQPGCPQALGCPGEQAPLCPRLYAEDAPRSPGAGLRVWWGAANQRDWNRTTLLLVWDPQRAPATWGTPHPQGHSPGCHLEEPGRGGVPCPIHVPASPWPRRPPPAFRQPLSPSVSWKLQTRPRHARFSSGAGAPRRFEHMQGPRPRCRPAGLHLSLGVVPLTAAW